MFEKKLLSQIKKHQKLPDGLWATEFGFKISQYTTYFFLKKGLSPNFVSLLSFSVASIVALLFCFQDYKCLMAGAVLWQFSAILDCSDGDLARVSGKSSLLGAWLDKSLDRLKEFLIFGSATWHVYMTTLDGKGIFVQIKYAELIFLLGFMIILLMTLSEYMSDIQGFLKPSNRKAKSVLFNRYILSIVDLNALMVTFFALIGHLDIMLAFYFLIFVIMFPYQVVKSVKYLK